MGNNPIRINRPCRICGKWFVPNPRVGDRQKTCGRDACKRKWHARKCKEWNRKNHAYFQANYLMDKLERLKCLPDGEKREPGKRKKSIKTGPPLFRFTPPLPRDVIQDVMQVQPIVVIEYIAQLLVRVVKEVMRAQHLEIKEKSVRLPFRDV